MLDGRRRPIRPQPAGVAPLLVEGPLGGGTSAFTPLFPVLSIGPVIRAIRTPYRDHPTHLVTSATGFSLASMTFMPSTTTFAQLLPGSEYRGRVLAIQRMVFLGAQPIGGPITGWVADNSGQRTPCSSKPASYTVAAAHGTKALDVRLSHRGKADPTVT